MGIFDSYYNTAGLNEAANGNDTVNEAELAEEMEYLEGLDEATNLSDDPLEACFEAMLQNEQNFNNIMMSIANEEMRYFVENGTDIVYEQEEGRVKKIINTILAFLDSAWTKIKSIFSKVLTTIDSWVSSDKRFVATHKDAIMSKAASIKINGYHVTAEKLDRLANEYGNVEQAAASVMGSASENPKTAFFNKIQTHNVTDKDGYKKALIKVAALDSKSDGISYAGKDVIDELSNGKLAKAKIKAGYDKSKKTIASLKKTVVSTAKDNSQKKSGAAISCANTTAKIAVTCLNVAQNVQLKATSQLHSNCRKIARKCVGATNESGDMINNETLGVAMI